jgi:hypothetical protein
LGSRKPAPVDLCDPEEATMKVGVRSRAVAYGEARRARSIRGETIKDEQLNGGR